MRARVVCRPVRVSVSVGASVRWPSIQWCVCHQSGMVDWIQSFDIEQTRFLVVVVAFSLSVLVVSPWTGGMCELVSWPVSVLHAWHRLDIEKPWTEIRHFRRTGTSTDAKTVIGLVCLDEDQVELRMNEWTNVDSPQTVASIYSPWSPESEWLPNQITKCGLFRRLKQIDTFTNLFELSWLQATRFALNC